MQSQLVVAAGMLRNGAEVVRLMSRKYQVRFLLHASLSLTYCIVSRCVEYACLLLCSKWVGAASLLLLAFALALALTGVWHVQGLRPPRYPPQQFPGFGAQAQLVSGKRLCLFHTSVCSR